MKNMTYTRISQARSLSTAGVGSRSPDAELWVNCVKHRTNNFVPCVVKQSAMDWLAGPNEIPAQAAAFTHSGRASQIWQAATPHLDCPLPASRSNACFPLALSARAPSARRMCAIA